MATEEAKIAAYREWVATGSPDPLERIEDCALLLKYPDLIEGAEPFGRVFGMTAVIEQAFCQWYGAHAYQGWGEWIELGTFLGSLTFPGVRGLRANQSPAAQNRKIRVYDLFRWEFTMAKTARYSGLIDYPKEGDWYVDFYRQFIAKVIDRVEVNQADLTRRIYSGETIEFLLIDVMKYPAIVRNVLKTYFPSLRAGSIIFHQDYLHFYESWITLTMYQMRNACKYLKALPKAGAVIFQMTRTPDESSLVFPLDATEIATGLIADAFAWSRSFIPDEQQDKVYAGECMMYFHAGKPDECRRLYQTVQPRFADSSELAQMKKYLSERANFELER